MDDLLPYYERELTFLRQMAGEFSEKYPAVAGRLQLDGNTCEDPHVERLLEGFALLAARIHRKLDDEFPEITEALLDALYPHYLRPVPSVTIAQFRAKSEHSPTSSGTTIPAGTPLHYPLENGEVCSFRSCYPVMLWPLEVTGASLTRTNRFVTPQQSANVAATLHIQLRSTNGMRLAQMPVESLRFFLHGQHAAVQAMYESLFVHTVGISLRGIGENVAAALPLNALQPVGFRETEEVLPYSDRSFGGYRLLQEYFSFPEKFLFFDIGGLGVRVTKEMGAAFEIAIALREPPDKNRLTALEQAVDASMFQLGCTPAVNLFERIAEPVRISQTQTQYRVVADQHRQNATEVYSINRVAALGSYQEEPVIYEPFYGLRRSGSAPPQFWYAHRRPSFRKNDEGTEVYISLVDLNFNPSLPAADMLTVQVTCTSRDQAGKLKIRGEFGELEAEGAALVEARCLSKPSRTVRPPLGQSLQWRLISHLSLNHLSISSGGRDALAELLRLYNFVESPAIGKEIDGIAQVERRTATARVLSETGVTFCRGTDVSIRFEESEYAGGSVYLLAAVIERFLGLYSSINSFSRLTAMTGKGVLKRWPPRIGEQILQ